MPPIVAASSREAPSSTAAIVTAAASVQHLSLAGQNGEPRRRCSPSAPDPWQTPSVCHLESCRGRFGNPWRVTHSADWYKLDVSPPARRAAHPSNHHAEMAGRDVSPLSPFRRELLACNN